MSRPLNSTDHAAPNLIVVTDFECPYCRRFGLEDLPVILQDAQRTHVGLVHWPLDYHPVAHPAAIAAECSHAQGRLHQFHDLAFRLQDSLPALLASDSLPTKVGVGDPLAFARCLEDPSVAAAVDGHVEVVRTLELSGTPAVIVDGTILGVRTIPRILEMLNKKRKGLRS
jgi:protein-disulfide isomerase